MASEENPNPNPNPNPKKQHSIRSKIKQRRMRGTVTPRDIAGMYYESLLDLKSISKSMITELAIVAEDQVKHAKGIVMAICDRILEVSPESRLPFLYLLDCIVKNAGGQYKDYFKDHLHEVITETYRKVNPDFQASLLHLLKTWTELFPYKTLREIENDLDISIQENQNSASSSELRHSGSQSQYFRSNPDDPKYLEVHQQSEYSAVDARHVRLSPNLQSCKQKSSFQDEEYDPEHHQLFPSCAGLQRIGALVMGGVEDVLSRQKPPPSTGIGPKIDASPKVVVDRPLYGFGSGRPSDWNGGVARIGPPGHGLQNEETLIASNHNNGYDKVRARFLVNAYGREGPSHEKPLKFARLDSDGISNDVSTSNSLSLTLPSERKWYALPPVGRNAGLTQPKVSYCRKDLGNDGYNQCFWPSYDDSAIDNANPGHRSFSPGKNICHLDSKTIRKSQPFLLPSGSIQDQSRSRVVLESTEHSLNSIGSEHSGFSLSLQSRQETSCLPIESHRRSACFTLGPESPHLVPRTCNHVQLREAVYSPVLPDTLSRTALPDPPLQSPIYSSRPLLLSPLSHARSPPLYPASFPHYHHHPSSLTGPHSTTCPPLFSRQPAPSQ